MGFAFSLPASGVLLFFGLAGLGLAAPFLLIAFVPAMMVILPRPGPWMESFKQLLGFTLIATTVWLVDVYGALTDRSAVTGFLAFLTMVGLGSWIFGRWGGPIQSRRQQLLSFCIAVLVCVCGGYLFLQTADLQESGSTTELTDLVASEIWAGEHEDVPWQPFSEEAIEATAGQMVFVDFTADWCLTCKVNEKTILNTEAVKQAMMEHGVVPLKADWTKKDDVISAWLQRYGRAGVPFYLVIPADRSVDTIPLPEVITPGTVISAIELASGGTL